MLGHLLLYWWMARHGRAEMSTLTKTSMNIRDLKALIAGLPDDMEVYSAWVESDKDSDWLVGYKANEAYVISHAEDDKIITVFQIQTDRDERSVKRWQS